MAYILKEKVIEFLDRNRSDDWWTTQNDTKGCPYHIGGIDNEKNRYFFVKYHTLSLISEQNHTNQTKFRRIMTDSFNSYNMKKVFHRFGDRDERFIMNFVSNLKKIRYFPRFVCPYLRYFSFWRVPQCMCV